MQNIVKARVRPWKWEKGDYSESVARACGDSITHGDEELYNRGSGNLRYYGCMRTVVCKKNWILPHCLTHTLICHATNFSTTSLVSTLRSVKPDTCNPRLACPLWNIVIIVLNWSMSKMRDSVSSLRILIYRIHTHTHTHAQILLEQHEQIKTENERIDDGEEMGWYSTWLHTSNSERTAL